MSGLYYCHLKYLLSCCRCSSRSYKALTFFWRVLSLAENKECEWIHPGQSFQYCIFCCLQERERERERERESLKSLVAEVSECSGAGWSRVSPRIITDNPLSPTNTKDKYWHSPAQTSESLLVRLSAPIKLISSPINEISWSYLVISRQIKIKKEFQGMLKLIFQQSKHFLFFHFGGK